MKNKSISNQLWDLWCIVSFIGIWPRFIEPNLLKTSRLSLPISNLPRELQGLNILQFSDLHFHSEISDRFLNRLKTRIEELKPDLIVFTGDFLCHSNSEKCERLKIFLKKIKAPLGCFAVLGNHDYEGYVGVNQQGDYDLIDLDSPPIGKGFERLFSSPPLTGKTTARANQLKQNQTLCDLLSETEFQVLHNQTKRIPIGNTYLNVCGVGEYMLNLCLPEKAFQGYDKDYPGIVLAHNPDAIPLLKNHPGNIILCGHTHGAQVNLPWIRRKLTLMENEQFKRGLFQVNNKLIYVNRGVGAVLPFRWLSSPEILLLTLKAA